MGMKLGAGAFAFCLFEETVDYARNDRRDFLSTVTAGLSFSGVYSLLGTLLFLLPTSNYFLGIEVADFA